jgi:hypothetical protein
MASHIGRRKFLATLGGAAAFCLLGSPSRSSPAALVHKLIELCLVPCSAQAIYKIQKLSLFILQAPKGVGSIFVEGCPSPLVGIVSRSHQLAPRNEQGCNKHTDKQQHEWHMCNSYDCVS